ncbi:MAG: DUF4340 domain-containing protein [Thermoanaerobaculales bacterium]|nr:DUF4340 domain-containing protein [Thermoanaerobaculales bacterium]
MRSRNLMILALVAFAVGSFIYFFERHQMTSDERAERADRFFPALDADEVVAAELNGRHGAVTLAKRGDEWRMTSPLDYPADGASVRSALQALAALDVDRSLAPDEVDPVEFGLDDPEVTAVLTTGAGEVFAIEVGGELPLGSKRAVRKRGEEAIHLCAGAFAAQLDREVDAWRSRDVVEVLEDDLASVEITTAEDRIVAVRSGDVWRLLSPVEDIADQDQMRSLISELNALRIRDFLPADADPAEHGLDAPEYRVVLTHADAAAAVTLELAGVADDAGSVVVRRNGSELFRISDSIRPRLAKAPVLWRSDTVWPFSTWDVATVEISSGDAQVVLERTEDDELGRVWRLEDGSLADDVGVRRRLTALADLEVREHDLVLPPTEVVGSVILVVDDAVGAEGLTYTFYAPIEDGGLAAVTVSTRANVMGVDAVTAETILSDPGSLRPEPEMATADEVSTTN